MIIFDLVVNVLVSKNIIVVLDVIVVVGEKCAFP